LRDGLAGGSAMGKGTGGALRQDSLRFEGFERSRGERTEEKECVVVADIGSAIGEF
jgi:hypothetical protein